MAWWIAQHVVTTALLAALVAMVCRMTRIGPVARHALWVLVLIKFVTPPVVAWPWAIPDPFGLSVVGPGLAVAEQASEGAPLSGETVDTVANSAAVEPTATWAEVTPPAPDAPADVALFWFLVVWVTGSVLLAALEAVRLARLVRQTRSASPAPAALVDRVAWHAATKLGLAPVPIVLVADAKAPSVWGLRRPRILWPSTLADQISEAGTDGLIVHELAHVKRRDHLIGWIELVGGIVWWWNPLFWSVRSALREQAELACDAWVISALPNGRRAYAESLLALSSEFPRPVRSSMAVVGISATTRKALERRLVMIMKGRASLRLTFVGICSLAVVAVATLPTWAASSQVAQPPVVAPASTTPPVMAAPPSSSAPQTVIPPVTPQASSRPRVAQRPAAVPPTRPMVQTVPPAGRGRGNFSPNLPEVALPLAEAFSKDQQAYLAEMLQKTAARREVFVAEMQRLQDELTKAGNLDDAVAIRDYLRMSTPVTTQRPTTGRGGVAGGGRGRVGGGGR